jgi:hypothetical protein
MALAYAECQAEVRVAVLDAVERAKWAAGARAALEQRYTAAYLGADLSAISARFRDSHSSLLRFLNPQYYLDIHALRQCVVTDAAISQSELGADAVMLARLHQHEEWLSERRADHARILGRYYQGDQTDWTHVRALIAWTDEFYAAFGDTEAPDAAQRLALASPADRAPLGSVSHRLTQQTERWSSGRAWMYEHLLTVA